jgi:hypothetical protein
MTLLLIFAVLVIVVSGALMLFTTPARRDPAGPATPDTVADRPNLPHPLRRPLRSRYLD